MTGLVNPWTLLFVLAALGVFCWWWWRLLDRLEAGTPASPTARVRMSRARRRRILLRDRHTCRYCERPGGLLDPDRRPWHVDHAVALANGGSDADDDNLALACEGCNLRKATKPIVPDGVVDGHGVIYASWADRRN